MNILGQEMSCLLDDKVTAGDHRIFWDGTDSQGNALNSGPYIASLEMPNSRSVIKVILIR
jgi:flagellar hook assembly protein FlgD